MLYSRHFSLSWFMACKWYVVQYLLLNPACSLCWFSSSFFSSLVVMIFVWTVCRYMIASKLVCSYVADPCYIGGAGYGWIVLRIVSLSYRQNYVTKEHFSLTMLSWTIKVFYICFSVPFLEKYHHICFLPCFSMRRSVLHFVYSLTSCFAMISSPVFSGSMLTWSFPVSFPFFILLGAAFTSHAIIGGTSSGYVCIVTAGSLSYNSE